MRKLVKASGNVQNAKQPGTKLKQKKFVSLEQKYKVHDMLQREGLVS